MKSKQVALSLAILLALGENTVTSDHSLAVGFRNTVSGSYSTAVGQSSTASGETSLAIGRSAQATANNTNAIGRSARAEGENATAIGHGSVSSGRNSNAFGSSAKASAEASTAVGNSTKASGISSTATGFNAEASGNFSSAYGNDARAKGNRSVAVGYNAKAEESATAVGNNANAGAANAVALGSGNTITARGGVGGSNVTSTQGNSVLLGNASTDRAATTETQANINGINYSGFAGVGSARNGVTSVGASGKERQVINVASGKVSSDSTDAINGSQLYAVANTVGGILNNHNTLIQNNINEIDKNKEKIADNERKLKDHTDVLQKHEDILNGHSQELEKHNKLIVNHDNQITRLTKENLRQDADLLRHEDQIQNHDIQLKNQTERMNNQEKRIDNQDKRLDYLDNRVDNHDARIENHSERIESHERRIEYNKTLATEALKEAKKHTSISAGNNVTVTTSTNAAGGTDYKVSVDKVKFGNVSLDNKGLNNGGNKITNVADGEVSATSKDAVNGSQLYQATSGISNGVNLLNSKIGKVGAGAAALAAIHPLDFDPDDKWNFAAGYGNYAGENAMALGAFYRPNEDTMFSVAGSMGNGENMVNAKEVQDLKAIVKAQNVEIQQMKASMGMAPQYEMKDVNFPDVPANHWAYEYVKDLADKGLVEGYPDGEFKGDRAMTRYEYAAIIYRALQLGAPIDGKMGRAINEFNPELARLRDLDRTRVDRISGKDNDRHKVERLRVNNKDNKQTNDYRDVYGSHIERNAK
ncbi:MAG: S-layer homology domain-containing protein [Veillonella sp.]|nr:S-layer homology domain-containing protein [Veillonella sp.]